MSAWGAEHVTLAVIDPHDAREVHHFAYYAEPSRRRGMTLCGRAVDLNAWRQALTIPIVPSEQDPLDAQRLPEDTNACPTCAEKLLKD